MPVHPRRGEHMRPVHGHSLRLVDRGGVAMIDMGVIFGVERDGSLIIGADGHAPLVHLLDGAKGAVLDLKAAFVFQEHDPVAASEQDRKSVVSGKRVSERVDIGGGGIIKKKTTQN